MVVVTHCNFPLRLAAPFPVARVGYSAASLLTAAAAELRRGAGVPRTDRLLKATVESPAAAEAAARRAAG
jgi:hypothetical protein